MLNDARGHLFDAPHMVVFPALAVMTAVLSFNLLGDAWRDWLDPRTRSQNGRPGIFALRYSSALNVKLAIAG
jgi:peptide/nickel transport system permease protein